MSEQARPNFGPAGAGDRAGSPPAAGGKGWKYATLAVLAGLALYYPVGMALFHRVGDDTALSLSEAEASGAESRAVAMMAKLIQREVAEGHWAANDPFFHPGTLLDNMPNFQQGMMAALARIAFELVDQIGRVRGSSQTDKDLQAASGQLQYPGTRWIFDFKVSWAPTASSEAQYRAARGALVAYNKRLGQGQAIFERRADNLLATIDRIALDIGSSSATIDSQIRDAPNWLIDTKADDVFYGVKGQCYAYYLVLRELAADFPQVMREKELAGTWGNMLDSLKRCAELAPWVVVNGAPDSQLLPSHLAGLGFFLLRARTQLREISNILLK
ncbi:MAG: DUF2333 family protein [Alphaproteobacteria bacterium]|nr:DUF2333 family protein [Alphaproteobacteria bacterium]